MQPKEVNDMLWSYSRLSSFEQCKYQFYLRYIIGDDELYLQEGNFYAELGSYVHSILEKIFNGELDVEDASQYFVDHYDDNVFYNVNRYIEDKAFDGCAEYFANLMLDWLKDYEVSGVEKKIESKIDGQPFIGYIDLLLKDKRTGEYTIVDHKSSQYPLTKSGKRVLKSEEEKFKCYKHQMYLYCHGIKELYGEFPKWIVWNHFKASAYVRIPFDKNEYKDALEWFNDTVSAIEKEDNFEPQQNFFYCRNLCAFRSSCEYATMSEDEANE